MNVDEIRSSLRQELPTLHVSQQNGRTVIRGRLPVLAYDGTEIDNYQIEIELNKNHPKAPPIVREVGGRIPHTVHRHNPAGTACLFVADQQWEYWDESRPVLDFIKNGPVRDFFFSQTYFEETGRWPFGERRHGFSGVVDYYLEILQTKSLDQVLAFLELLAADSIGSGKLCYCDKVKWLSDCHIERILHFRSKISRHRARYTLNRLLAEPGLAGWSVSDVLQIRKASSVSLGRQLMPMKTTTPTANRKAHRRKGYRP